MIDDLQTKSISDIYVKLYNSVIEKFVLFKNRTQIKTFLYEIVDHVM